MEYYIFMLNSANVSLLLVSVINTKLENETKLMLPPKLNSTFLLYKIPFEDKPPYL